MGSNEKHILLPPEVVHVAFINWLLLIGYRANIVPGGMEFYAATVNKRFPRNVVIFGNGKLNKPARMLFKEFAEHLKA
ncbi:hypothetical protein ACLIL3_014870 [Acinetobacter radioresistens]|uniref:hypothetical protein n=1 Tax=Acinetobacter radioresistens TaxID=40216 RepID=UPI0039848837